MAKSRARTTKKAAKKPESTTKINVTNKASKAKKPTAKKKPTTKKKIKKPESRFILHRFNGDEIYRFKEAKIFALKSFAGGYVLWFEVQAHDDAIQRCADTAELEMAPSVSVGLDLPAIDISTLVAQQFLLPGTKTDNEDSCKSLLYYCEHEPLRNNVIDIVSRKGNKFWIRWTATTKDVNYYDGSKPLTKVEIEGEFPFQDIEKWETK